jgi:signal transduction histidine kinase
LLSLIDNAVQHGRANGRVEVYAESDAQQVKLSVRDDGPGIARTGRKRLFGRFVRGATAASGTGLGLYLVDQVARAHGGRVDLQSEDGQGATFTLVLPRVPPGDAAPLEPSHG